MTTTKTTLALLALAFTALANAASQETYDQLGIGEKDLKEIVAAIGHEPELIALGQYTTGEKIRTSLNTQNVIIVFAADTFYAVTVGQKRVRAYVKCEDIDSLQTKNGATDNVIIADVLGDGAVHRLRFWHNRGDADPILAKLKACAEAS